MPAVRASRPALWASVLLAAACAPGLVPAPRPGVPVVASIPAPPSEEVAAALRARRLAMPVAGVRAAQVRDAFADGRGERLHLAVDIMAPRGTPVLSADDGRLLKLRSNALGGITVYAVDPEERFVYYYAHLERYRDGIAEGMPVQRGDTIGFVGTTGNAPPDVPHLHFQVARLLDARRYWEGVPIDPLPYLREAAGDGARVVSRTAPSQTQTQSPTPTRVGVPRPTVPVLEAEPRP
ncbi:M23 family metallopeptidase [Roseisolibacter sp. H3M3-2]|uniref:M23 family metallopeptidase n=1 Tax=Roseisolibacter sp. H3M3-2 TaxID=3031323 RepID=UPI0023DA624F|nr:M23 family metallopeptidase [Roseisolibacter sp. H3M3-2]MDF1502847.1 M23 family metallopeptidase [Roseisolibacter sp. H3M3-2]